ncbi:DUF624 domain-containing protein [Rhizobium sp. CSW-27]|uniref:DUF624 domain-containing protein n=1 Tax=Rhizobium sp. CSW-27 TaxID=2839985 RepID=UPI001C00EF49|nr:DUF624 domain-containing protein [Rhizobium sp. CSW-27]MBT9369685.1 DUF624 domain-containing protein [Rhizobium sp. CSW-27]
MQWLEAFWTKEGKGIPKDAPKKTGLALIADILAREWWELVKLNLLFLLASLPLVTLPAALFAIAHVCRLIVEDRNVYLLRDFREAMRAHALRASLWAIITAGAVSAGTYAIIIYGTYAQDALIYVLPLTVSLVATVFAAVVSSYFVMVSVAGRGSIRTALRQAALAALLHPLPALASLAVVALLWLAHVLFYPVSVFMPAMVNFSFGMFAVAFGAHGAVAQVLAPSGEALQDREI